MSGTFDLIRRMRTEVPRVEVAAKAAWWFGVLCLGAGAWNVLMATVVPLDGFPLLLRSVEFFVVVGMVTVSGFVSLGASGRFKDDPGSGARWGKVALWIFMGAILLLGVGIRVDPSFEGPELFGWLFRLMMIPVSAQFVIPAWFAIGYLNRLEEASTGGSLFVPSDSVMSPLETESVRYREGILPWGTQATFMVMMALVMVPAMLVQKHMGLDSIPWVLFPGFLFLIGGPFAWNELTSSFQRSRDVLAAHRVGISLLFFNAPDPFCKLLIYRDGVEIRAVFTRYFIPYDKCVEPPSLVVMFTSSILFRTRLPGVPEIIRIQSGKADEILAEIEKARLG